MIRLTLIGEQDRATFVTSAPYFRIIGGMVSIAPSAGLEGEAPPLVRHVGEGSWKHANELRMGMRFEGRMRLVFGLPRDPSGVSDELEGLSITGKSLSANGIPFAVYDQELQMWRGAGNNRWWHAFRIESASFRESTSKSIASAEGASSCDSTRDQNETAPPLN